jgi:hypothetical protein
VADFYIDPSSPVNGTGTIDSPFNAWSSITLAAGNRYLQKRGTAAVFSANLAVTGANGTSVNPITYGAYGDFSLDRPLFVFTNSAFFNLTSSRTFINIEDIEFDSLQSGAACMTIGSGCTDINVRRCKFKTQDTQAHITCTGSATIAFQRITLEDNDFTGSGLRAFSFLATSATVLAHTGFYFRRNKFGGDLKNGIRITMETAAAATSSINDVEISYNIFDGVKQAAVNIRAVNLANSDTTAPTTQGDGLEIFKNKFTNCGLEAGNTSGTLGTPFFKNGAIYRNELRNCSTTGGLIQGTHRDNFDIFENICIGAVPVNSIDGSGIFADRYDTNIRIFRNVIGDCLGVAGVNNSGAGIQVWMAQNVKVYSNIIYNCLYGFDIGANSNRVISGLEIYNNTVFDIVNEIAQFDIDATGMTATSLTMRNNFFADTPVGIDARLNPQTNVNYNAWLNVPTRYINQTAGANDITVLPANVSSDYAPKSGSSLLTAGQDIGYVRDMMNRLSKQHVGAYGRSEYAIIV